MKGAQRTRLARHLDRKGAALCGLFWLASCTGPGSDGPPGNPSRSDGGLPTGPCLIAVPTRCPDPMPRYADVKPIIDQRCVVCHSGQTELWPLTTYQHVASWYDTVRDDVRTCAMPPPDSGSAITDAERLAILTWIRCGYPL